MPPRPTARAACLPCRLAKTKCDAQNPCGKCAQKGLKCYYQPSRRGGTRRGINFVTEHGPQPGPPHIPHLNQSTRQLKPVLLSPDTKRLCDNSSVGPSLDPVSNLLNSQHGIRNLDRAPALASTNNTNNATSEIFCQALPVRVYGSDEDILNAYYIHIYPFLPILTPPSTEVYQDKPSSILNRGVSQNLFDRECLPHWPTSSLTQAISAILTMIPLSSIPDSDAESTMHLRRSCAQMYAEASYEMLNEEIDECNWQTTQTSNFQTHRHNTSIPSKTVPVLALVILSIYEFCQRGNVSKMRARANQAISTAIDFGLHKLGKQCSEADRRAWWSTMFISYLSSIDHQTVPVITLTDPRISTPFPEFHLSPEPWPLLLKAENANALVLDILNDSGGYHPDGSVDSSLSEKILGLDSEISTLMKESDSIPWLQSESRNGIALRSAENMWLISRLLIHSSRLRLHRYQAFIDVPLFTDKYCDLPAIQTRGTTDLRQQRAFLQTLHSSFPFTEQQSSIICLRSSLAIARTLEKLSPSYCPLKKALLLTSASTTSRSTTDTGHIIPFYVCGALVASYALLMLHHRVRAALASNQISEHHYLLNSPESNSEVQDAERLLRELEEGIGSIISFMKTAFMFEGVSGMALEIQVAYLYTLSANCN